MIIIWIIAIIIFFGVLAVLSNIIKNWRTRLDVKQFLIFLIVGVVLLYLLFSFIVITFWLMIIVSFLLLIFSLFFGAYKKTH